MIKQHPSQLLEHGKVLCGKTFSSFVEAWNWLIGSFAALRGDADLDPKNGHIQRDDSGQFPVLRLVNANFGGAVTVTGTDGVSVTGNTIILASASDSCVTATATESGGVITLTLGAYWK